MTQATPTFSFSDPVSFLSGFDIAGTSPSLIGENRSLLRSLGWPFE